MRQQMFSQDFGLEHFKRVLNTWAWVCCACGRPWHPAAEFVVGKPQPLILFYFCSAFQLVRLRRCVSADTGGFTHMFTVFPHILRRLPRH